MSDSSAASAKPLIVGGGPVGKAAALFLARNGMPTRIIDRNAETSPYSKALAVSPRTLDLLEPTGITEKMLKLGFPIRGAQFWRNEKPLNRVSLSVLEHKYPFMLALSQATTERLLEEALAQQGIAIERNKILQSCSNTSQGVEATIQHTSGGDESVAAPWLLGADGAHSTVRHALGLKFPGTSFNNPWYLVEVHMRTSIAEDHAHIVFLSGGGFLFVMRVVDDITQEAKPAPLWRVFGNMPDPLSKFRQGEAVGPPLWTSSFHIVHRIAEHLQVGNIFLAGDAAHLHSPVGARGMNLGIEDAYVFSELIKRGNIDRYSPLRHHVDYMAMKRVEMVSRMARGESIGSRVLRLPIIKFMPRIAPIRHQIMRTVTGLDHEVQLN